MKNKFLKTFTYLGVTSIMMISCQKKIDEAAADGIITESLRLRAHIEVRVLGNDVMHDDWMEVTGDDFSAAHRYTQRILEAFYDHRTTVEQTLISKGRLQTQQPVTPAPAQSSGTN